MRKRKIILISLFTAFVLLVGAFCFFKLTLPGQQILYHLFGGNDLHLSSNHKELYWFDVRHSNDPTDVMFQRIESTLSEFQPDLVLVEGGYDTFCGSREEAIQEGESAFVTYLAKEKGITVEDIEPPFQKQIENLQLQYSASQVLAMYLIRQIRSYVFLDDNSSIDIEQELTHMTQDLQENGLKYNGTTVQEIYSVINEYIPSTMDSDHWRDLNK